MAPFGVSNLQVEDLNGNNAAVTVIGYGKQGSNGISWGLNYKAIEGVIDGESVDGGVLILDYSPISQKKYH